MGLQRAILVDTCTVESAKPPRICSHKFLVNQKEFKGGWLRWSLVSMRRAVSQVRGGTSVLEGSRMKS
jgi:hypothetical protein